MARGNTHVPVRDAGVGNGSVYAFRIAGVRRSARAMPLGTIFRAKKLRLRWRYFPIGPPMISEKTTILGSGGHAQVLRITRPATSSGRSTAIESPMGPPQSWRTNTNPFRPASSISAWIHSACSWGV